jgi:GNAT superfamily N-acetyltransferase
MIHCAEPASAEEVTETMIQIRDAVPGDASAIADFQIRMARETEEIDLDPEVCAKGVKAVFADPSLGRYFVAEHDRDVVGSLMTTYEWSDWRNGTVWWIQSVFVVPELRGKGIYRRLYEHVQQLVRQSDTVRGIRLYVDIRNAAAQEVYSRLGMNGDHYRLFEWMKVF